MTVCSGEYMDKRIQVTRSSMPSYDEYMDEIRDLWETHWLTNMGEKHNRLDEELKGYLGVPNISLFSSGHLALEDAIESMDLEGEVITTPFTFASTTHAIVRKRLEPVFCDINADDCTMDAEKIEDLITERTSAILPVHIYGNVCDTDTIENIAGDNDLKVLYDAAHAFGVTKNDVGIGNFGDASVFSFHATKVFNTIEGGAVTFDDPDLKKVLDGLRNFGITGPESVEYIGGNAKMNEFQAAMGLCNIKRVDDEIEKRRKITERYVSNLEDVDGIKLQKPQNGVKHNHSYFPVIFDGYKKTRDQVHEELKRENIFTRKYFYPLTKDFACYSARFKSADTPVADFISKRVLTLPLYADLEPQDADRICDIIKR